MSWLVNISPNIYLNNTIKRKADTRGIVWIKSVFTELVWLMHDITAIVLYKFMCFDNINIYLLNML